MKKRVWERRPPFREVAPALVCHRVCAPLPVPPHAMGRGGPPLIIIGKWYYSAWVVWWTPFRSEVAPALVCHRVCAPLPVPPHAMGRGGPPLIIIGKWYYSAWVVWWTPC